MEKETKIICGKAMKACHLLIQRLILASAFLGGVVLQGQESSKLQMEEKDTNNVFQFERAFAFPPKSTIVLTRNLLPKVCQERYNLEGYGVLWGALSNLDSSEFTFFKLPTMGETLGHGKMAECHSHTLARHRAISEHIRYHVDNGRSLEEIIKSSVVEQKRIGDFIIRWMGDIHEIIFVRDYTVVTLRMHNTTQNADSIAKVLDDFILRNSFGRNLEEWEDLLLNSLKKYMQQVENFDSTGYATPELKRAALAGWNMYVGDTVRNLGEIGYTNTVQFFLDNIDWTWVSRTEFEEYNLYQYNTLRRKRIKYRIPGPYSTMGNALISIEEIVFLPQCMDALMRSEDGTVKALMIEHVTGHIHGKNFLQEVEKLIETSSNPERWQAVKERLESNAFYGHSHETPQEKMAKESALLEKLKGYMAEDDSRNRENVKDVIGELWEVAELGSTNVIQFFLNNITWLHSDDALGRNMIAGGASGSVMRNLGYMGDVLIQIKDVLLHQCMDALIRSKDGTMQALSLEYVTGRIHGKNFLQEVTKLAETSSNPERWKAMQERIESNTMLMLR